MVSRQKKTPWNRSNPKPKRRKTKLSPAQKSKAKSLARKAGRPYPNLVDNMRVTRKRKAKK